MKKIRLVTLIGVLIVENLYFKNWFSCWLFKDNFYYPIPKLIAQLTNAINADKGIPIFIIRMVHNKIFGLAWGVMQTMLQYWDIRFLMQFIGLIGGIGVVLGAWYFFTTIKHHLVTGVLILIGLVFSMIELFFTPQHAYPWRIIIFACVFEAISFFGIQTFLKVPSLFRYIGILILIAISLIALVLFPLAYQNFCLKI